MTRFFLILFLLPSVTLARDIDPEGGRHFFSDLGARYLKKSGSYRFISEAQVFSGFSGQTYSHLRLGLNKRLASFLKLGFHLRVQNNTRNNEDWRLVEPALWGWRDKRQITELVTIPELLLRHMVISSLRGELRVRYEWNTTYGQSLLRLRPNLTYFHFPVSGPPINYYLQWETFGPLDFAERQINQNWVYLGFLYHQSATQKWGFNLSYVQWAWRSSRAFKEVFPNDSYQTQDEALLLGFQYLYSH